MVGGKAEGVEVDFVVFGGDGFALEPGCALAGAAQIDDALEGVLVADFLPLVRRKSAGTVDLVRSVDGEVAVFDKVVVPEPAQQEDGEEDCKGDGGAEEFHRA